MERPKRTLSGTWPERIKGAGGPVTAAYLIFIAGGIWHRLGWFQGLMSVTAGPLLITVNTWLIAYLLFSVVGSHLRTRFILWVLGITAAAATLEIIGLATGFPFGTYVYGPALIPQIRGLPLAIVFAWPGLLICTLCTARLIAGRAKVKMSGLYVLFIPVIILVLFDGLMEPAAVRLNYWFWLSGTIPWHNFAVWAVWGVLSLFAAMRLGLLGTSWPSAGAHIMTAQALYFILVLV
jgi:putative membrane protein